MLAEKRLHASKRRTPIDPEKLAPEQRKLLVEFATYDFERPMMPAPYMHNDQIPKSVAAATPPVYLGFPRDSSPTWSSDSSSSGSTRSAES